MPPSSNSMPASTAPVDVKPIRRTCKPLIHQLLRLCVFIALTVIFVYESSMSVIQYIDNPTAVTLSEREATSEDYPYLLICERALFLKDQSENNKYLESVFIPLGPRDSNEMKDYPWESVPLQDFKQDQFENVSTHVGDEVDMAGHVRPDNPTKATIVVSKTSGACMLLHPWSKKSGERFLTIFGVERTPMVTLRFVHNPEDIYKIYFNEKEVAKEHFVNMKKQQHLELQIKKSVRKPTKHQFCSEENGYSQEQCRDKCIGDHVLERLTVKCGLPWLKPAVAAPNCKNFNDYFNLRTAIAEAEVDEKLRETCATNCPKACTNIEYTVTEKTYDAGVTDPYVLISVDPTVRVVNEFRTYKFMNMIGDIGGIAGILLGISLFGIYDYVSQCIRDRKQRKEAQEKPCLCF